MFFDRLRHTFPLLLAACAPALPNASSPAAASLSNAAPVATVRVPEIAQRSGPSPLAQRDPQADHPMTPEEAAEDPRVRALVHRLDDWARSLIQVKWVSSSRTEIHCFDKNDGAVACTSAAALRHERHRQVVEQATATNSGTLALQCWSVAHLDTENQNYESTRAAAGLSTLPLDPGQTVVFPKVEPSDGELMFGSPAVICSIPTATLSNALGVDLLPVGRGDHLLLVLTTSDSYLFISNDRAAPGLFEWFEGGVLLK